MTALDVTVQAAKDGHADQWLGLWAALLGAMVGAIASGGVTLWLQVVGRRETLKTNCVHLTLKLSRISSSVTAAYEQVTTAVKEAEAASVNGDLWHKLLPLTGLENIYITAEEMAVFVHMRDYDFLNRVMRIDDRHNGVVEALALYAAKRTALTDMLPAQMQGRAGSVTITDAKLFARIAPRMAELKPIAEDVVKDLRDCTIDAQAIAADVGPRLRKFFKDKRFPVLAIPDERKVDNPAT
jgi:hypothetical protein